MNPYRETFSKKLFFERMALMRDVKRAVTPEALAETLGFKLDTVRAWYRDNARKDPGLDAYQKIKTWWNSR